MRQHREEERRVPGPNDWGPRSFETVAIGQHYRLKLPGLGLTFDFDRIRVDRGDLRGYLTVRSEMAGARTIDGVLLAGTIYLGSADARQRFARMLTERAAAPDIDFVGLLEELSLRSEAAERQGNPPVRMRAVQTPANPAEQILDVYGIRLPQKHATMIYGLGDSLKSIIVAIALGELEQRGIRTMLVDWEMSQDDWKQRLEQLYGPAHPDVLYIRAERPLVTEIDRLQRIVHDEKIQFVGLDSVGFGCAGPPESAEEALGFMRCVRRLGVGSLLVAHQAKGENGDKSPFGSAFWFNSCRAIYHVKRAEVGLDDTIASVACYPTKANLSRRGGPVGLEFTFSDTDITVKRREVADMSTDLAAGLSLRHRVLALLKSGPQSIPDIANDLDAKIDSVTKVLTRGNSAKHTFTALDGGAGTVRRYGLLDRSAS